MNGRAHAAGHRDRVALYRLQASLGIAKLKSPDASRPACRDGDGTGKHVDACPSCLIGERFVDAVACVDYRGNLDARAGQCRNGSPGQVIVDDGNDAVHQVRMRRRVS